MKRIFTAAILMTALGVSLVGCSSQVCCPIPPASAVVCNLSPDETYYTYTLAYDNEGRASLKRVPYKPVCIPSPPPPEVGVVVSREDPRCRSLRHARRVCCPVCVPGTTSTTTLTARETAGGSARHIRTARRAAPALPPQTVQHAPARVRDPNTPETLCQRALRIGAEQRASQVRPPAGSAGYIIVNDPDHPIRRETPSSTLPAKPGAAEPVTQPDPVSSTRVEPELFKIPEPTPEPTPEPESIPHVPDDMPPPIRHLDVPATEAESAETPESTSTSASGDATPPPLRQNTRAPMPPLAASTKLIGTDMLPEYIPNGDVGGPASAYMETYVGNLTYIQNAEAGTYRDGVLTLHRVSPTTSFIGGARGHASGTVSTNAFLRDWVSGQMPYRTQAPRALVSILTETGEILARVELSQPTTAEDELRYAARLLQGSIPESFGDISLMIEPLE